MVARIKGINKLFAATVVVPTALAMLYFGLIASDIYISESRFVVRSPQKQAATGISALLQGAGFSRSQDDTYTVHDFIMSRDALQELEKQSALSKLFSDSKIDIFSRFTGLDADHSFENLYRYYQKRVDLEIDGVSSITILRTSAFSAADSQKINEVLLELSEKLVNQLNERGRQDMIRFASMEVATAEKNAKAATLAVLAFRSQKSVFDPERQSVLQLQLVSKMQDEYISTKTQLAQIRALAKENPQITALQKKLDTLQSEINSETEKVAGGEKSLSSKSAEYERLMLDRTFADKQLAIAFASLEQARNDAQRKQLYLERIVQPSTPDKALEPKRSKAIISVFALGMLAWGILSLLLAGIKEHHD